MTVTVYATTRCPQCHATQRQLDRMGVNYSVVNVDDDSTALSRLRELGYQQVPVVVTNECTWTGYRPDLLKQLGERSQLSECNQPKQSDHSSYESQQSQTQITGAHQSIGVNQSTDEHVLVGVFA